MLEKKPDFSVQPGSLSGKEFCRSEHHGRVPVMTAGVHDSCMSGAERKMIRFRDGQSINIGAKKNASRFCSFGFFIIRRFCRSAKNRNGSGGTGALHGQTGDTVQLIQNKGCGFVLLKRQFRDGMKLAPPGHHFRNFLQDVIGKTKLVNAADCLTQCMIPPLPVV